MLEQHEIEYLLAVGEREREELMGVRPAARTSDSDSENEGSSPSPPAIGSQRINQGRIEMKLADGWVPIYRE